MFNKLTHKRKLPSQLSKYLESNKVEFFCEKCNKQTKGTDHHTFNELPPVLICSFDMFNSDKKTIGEKFPIPMTLDMWTYLDGLEPDVIESLEEDWKENYELFAVVHGIGESLDNFAYSVAVKREDKQSNTRVWVEFCDSVIDDIEPSKIEKKLIPHILMYRKVK